ncbi:MAG: DUF3572 family protein [Methylocystis sp.]|uniref:DUF3572 family protein n=1 Tax=Methylocystis sp. TaxID=1911079 RepID=UPI003DA452D7
MKTGRLPFNNRPPKAAGPPASELALRALAFLAQDEERAARFLALTGLEGSEVRNLLGEPAFQLAVLDHLAGDEALLLAFVGAESLPPEVVGRARRALGGGEA